MRDVIAEVVGETIGGLLGRIVALVIIHCCMGCVLFFPWDMALREAWPALPFIPWFHFAMVSFAWSTLRDGVLGGKLPK